VDASGKTVVLRGCNLGNWLLQEMWMHNMRTEGIPDQYTMEQVLSQRFGEAAKDRLMDTYRRNYITERDFRIIRSFGMNVVRLPILYTLLEDDDHPFQLKPDAWVHIDRAINMAEAEGIYTILDLHGAPGGQNPWHHCGRADQNKLWGDEQNKRRTIWLWQQLAKRYRGRSAVAGYDLLNEPYTAPKEELRKLALALYRAIREVDADHIVIFPALGDGFGFYGDPKGRGLRNVAFTTHFYPGFFGWGEPTVETHTKWLTEGVHEWQRRVQASGVPFLVGEFNPVLRAAGGAEMTARAFDIYASFGWAATMWTYKVLSSEGGIAGGSWGMVTNPPAADAPLVKAETWSRKGWDRSFGDASVRGRPRFTAPGSGPVTVYLVVKAGANAGGKVDVVVDELGLRDESTGQEMVTNGGFGAATGWTEWHHAGSLTVDYQHGGEMPAGGKGEALRLTGTGFVSAGVFQTLTAHGGHTYTLRGVFRDVGSSPDSAWVEVYLRPDWPQEGQDYVAGPSPGSEVDLNSSSLEEIESYFASLPAMDYVVYEELRDALTKSRPQEGAAGGGQGNVTASAGSPRAP
jgi:glucan 1,3-beta-glucosidase